MTKHFDGRMGRHADCGCQQCRGAHDQSTARTRDASVPIDWNSLIRLAVNGANYPASARRIITDDEWREMITAAAKGGNVASTSAQRAVIDALRVAAAPARDVRIYQGLSDEDRAAVDAAGFLSRYLSEPKAEFTSKESASAKSVTDGSNMRARARANGARAIAAMQKTADEFWKRVGNPPLSKQAAIAAEFWGQK